MVRIAVDGMGGDFAPHAVVKGAESAVRDGIAEIILVGDETALKPLVADSTMEIVHTPVVVRMDESPSTALRKKGACSMNKAFELLKAGDVQGVVTAGNSGAAMAFAIFTLGRLPGVERPAIATLHPNAAGGTTVLVDSGGNVECKPAHLVQFAMMGDVFARCAYGLKASRLGILSNATEETKGNDLTREAHAVLKNMELNYLGYIEGTDMHNGKADVVITDGFVGNVTLKVTEGTAELLMGFLIEKVREIQENNSAGYETMAGVLRQIQERFDYSNIGGAPLLGVDGVSVICHGKSNDRAIRNAIAMARDFVDNNLNESIKATMQNHELLQKIKER